MNIGSVQCFSFLKFLFCLFSCVFVCLSVCIFLLRMRFSFDIFVFIGIPSKNLYRSLILFFMYAQVSLNARGKTRE